LFGRYFSLVDLSALPRDAVVMDVGCGSGRWATFVAPHAGRIILVDAAAKALEVARSNLASHSNCEFFLAELSDFPVPDASCDLIYSLGVLHHVPDTAKAIVSVSKKLKPGGQIPLYLYYRFDNRPFWFRAIWKVSDFARRMISRLPHRMRRGVTNLVATFVYWPLASIARLIEMMGKDPSNLPLSYYRDLSFYTMRTDALDRLGTALEHRFTRDEIRHMLDEAGLVDIEFREDEPFWCVSARRTR
jgi:ubiquinone/menaquinone biosynthesis C-methylase UbiE